MAEQVVARVELVVLEVRTAELVVQQDLFACS